METRLGCHCAVKYHPIVFMSPSHFEPVESVRANNKLLSLDIFKDIRKRGKKNTVYDLLFIVKRQNCVR